MYMCHLCWSVRKSVKYRERSLHHKEKEGTIAYLSQWQNIRTPRSLLKGRDGWLTFSSLYFIDPRRWMLEPAIPSFGWTFIAFQYQIGFLFWRVINIETLFWVVIVRFSRKTSFMNNGVPVSFSSAIVAFLHQLFVQFLI